MDFAAWCKTKTGLRADILPQGVSGTDWERFVKSCRHRYEQEQKKTALLSEWPDRADGRPDFNKWLYAKSGHTCGELYRIAEATDSARGYEKMMEWYRNRFYLDVDNPFVKDAVASGNGEKNGTDGN